MREEFYGKLQAIYDRVPTGDIKIMLGELNAKVGREVLYRPAIRRHIAHEKFTKTTCHYNRGGRRCNWGQVVMSYKHFIAPKFNKMLQSLLRTSSRIWVKNFRPLSIRSPIPPHFHPQLGSNGSQRVLIFYKLFRHTILQVCFFSQLSSSHTCREKFKKSF